MQPLHERVATKQTAVMSEEYEPRKVHLELNLNKTSPPTLINIYKIEQSPHDSTENLPT